MAKHITSASSRKPKAVRLCVIASQFITQNHPTFGSAVAGVRLPEIMKHFLYWKIRWKIFVLSMKDNCMPLEIFSISNQLAGLYPDKGVQDIFDKYIDHENAYIRRAMVRVMHFIDEGFFEKNIDSVRKHLKDTDEWVSYETISILSKRGYIAEKDRGILEEYAMTLIHLNTSELEELKPKSAKEYRAKMAAEVLVKEEQT